VGISRWDKTYIFPAEYDIFLDYSPTEYDTGAGQSGYVNISVEHVKEPIPSFVDSSHIII
jgi:hypothetical protein